MFTGIDTMYKNRENSYKPLADLIYKVCTIKQGNYLIYFPSFSFMNSVALYLRNDFLTECKAVSISPELRSEEMRNSTTLKFISQKPNMTETERQEFLQKFENTSQTMIAFAVLGGIFGEGIDLTGLKLIGCVIVSVGLPGLGGEKDLICDYYNQANHQGFDYAYRLPGFNKVMQAAGRVIRTEEDKGIVILIDQRYGRRDYKELYSADWSHYKMFNDQGKLEREVESFWEI
jgi:DNA excision repair protein ERCC-2